MNTKLAKNKRIRIALLELLRSVYPGALDRRALMFAIDNLGYPLPEAEVAAHLSYLMEKGYVFNEQKSGEGYEISFSYLTAEGWDLLDGLRDNETGVDTRL